MSKKSQFIQRLIAYWTLKRQFRNGVPLLRRLQSSHLARRDETNKATSQATSDISELYRQLKYWQCLRQDLERARLLCELVRKREKLKKELTRLKSQCIEVELCPLVVFLRKLLELLRARDTGEIFIEPVDQSEVPDYGDVVKNPMDLSTMRQKVDDFQYNSLEEFKADFKLMIDNCLAYNNKDTVFYRAGLKMRDQGGMLIRQAAKELEAMGIDGGSGLLRGGVGSSSGATRTPSTPAEETLPAEIDKQLAAIADPANTMGEDEIMCKLLQLLDSCQNLKHSLARGKRVRMVKAEIAKLNKKKGTSDSGISKSKKEATDSGDSSDEEQVKSKSSEKHGPEDSTPATGKRSRRKKTWDDFVEGSSVNKDKASLESSSKSEKDKSNGTPSKHGGGSDSQTSSPSGVNRRTAVLFTRKAAAATGKVSKPDDAASPLNSSNPTPRRRGHQPKKHLENSGFLDSSTECVTPSSHPPTAKDSFSVYRSGGDIQGETDSEEGSSCSACSSSDGSDSGSDCDSDSESPSSCPSDSDSGESISHAAALEQLQLVWAKCRGYPWYPALIINPKMPRGYIHNGVPIPSPPADVLALANNYTEPVYLVLFFDTKRTWQWLPRNKLEPLGITPELDHLKLIESRKPADRKAVRKAYQEALTHRTQVDKKEEEPKPEESAVAE